MIQKRRKKLSEKEQFKESIYKMASWLAADTGCSFSVALGCYLGVENPTYGWEDNLSEEEFEALFDRLLDSPIEPGSDDMPF